MLYIAKNCPLMGIALYLDCLECDTKECKQINNYKYNKIVIGIDQSYASTGISIFADKKKKRIKSIELSKIKNNSLKRELIKEELNKIAEFVINQNPKEVICVIERIRLQSSGFLNINYIKSIGALNALITDVFYNHNIKVYSVDTRCWKAQVVGSSKPYHKEYYGMDVKKVPTILWCIKQGWESDIKEPVSKAKRKGVITDKEGNRYTYNDNKADSAAIAMFGFIGEKDKLKEEH